MCLFREIQDTAGARIPQAPRPLWTDSLHSTFPGLGMPEARAGRMKPCHLTPASPKILPLLPHGKSGSGSCRELSTTMIKLFVRKAPSHTFQGQTPAHICWRSTGNPLWQHLQPTPIVFTCIFVYPEPYLIEYWYRRLSHPAASPCTSSGQCLLSLGSWFCRPSSKWILCTLVAPKVIKRELRPVG